MVMGELSTKTDVGVIGGGPGGYTAAIRAAQLGLDVILIEKSLLGGCCTNVGCIPSKALIHAAELYHDAASDRAKRMGLQASIRLDFQKTQEWQAGVVKDLRDGISTLCKLNGVEIIKGRAFFTSSKTLSVETESGLRTIEFGKAVIATGTEVMGLENLPFDHEKIISSDDVFALDSLPAELIIVGGGYIAVEMAALFARLGSKVTIVYRGERLLRNMEPELGEAALKGLRSLGAEVLFKSEVARADGNEAVVRTEGAETRIRFDKMLVAAGRTPHFESLGLGRTLVRLDSAGLIEVDATMKSADDGIYAVGDAVAGPQLAHKAFRQGKVAAEAIAGQKSAFDNIAIPMVVFAEPELASVGLTEAEAKARGYGILIGKMPFSASGRAKSMARPEGFVKIIADKAGGTILGAHIAGAGAGTLIAEAALAIEMGAVLEDLAATIHAHPTMPESVMEAAEDALGRGIHLYRKRAK
ncbi:dihydrolipoyl dehydrogenase [Candidatus Micrarchaeota archaeon]|nr:dihydrolipoyl dehydrogenase [Candidatus Micrarchaeota archaeon]